MCPSLFALDTTHTRNYSLLRHHLEEAAFCGSVGETVSLGFLSPLLLNPFICHVEDFTTTCQEINCYGQNTSKGTIGIRKRSGVVCFAAVVSTLDVSATVIVLAHVLWLYNYNICSLRVASFLHTRNQFQPVGVWCEGSSWPVWPGVWSNHSFNVFFKPDLVSASVQMMSFHHLQLTRSASVICPGSIVVIVILLFQLLLHKDFFCLQPPHRALCRVGYSLVWPFTTTHPSPLLRLSSFIYQVISSHTDRHEFTLEVHLSQMPKGTSGWNALIKHCYLMTW